MDLVAHTFVTLNDTKDYLGISGSTYDNLLKQIINTAVDFCESYCQRRFIETAHTSEYHSGDCSNALILKNSPISSSPAVVLEEATNPLASDSGFRTIASRDYFVDPDAGMIETNFALQKGIRNYRVTYTAGWTLANVPNDLKLACWELVSKVFNIRKVGGISRQTLGDMSVDFEKELDTNKTLQSLLGKYVRT